MVKVATDRPVFVVGCPRSGTTMLTLMLHAHPRIAIPSAETRFLLPIWAERHRFSDLTSRDQRRALGRAITARGSRVRELGLRPRDLVKEIVAGPPTLGSALGIVFRAYARQHGKQRWGDKRPLYAQHVATLLRLFPDAQIIHIVRDGRGCVASLKRMPWFHQTSLDAMALWSLSTHCADVDQRGLPADTFYRLRYEDLVADPRCELARMCAFLDEDFDEAMLKPHRLASTVPARKHWHGNLFREVGAADAGAWQSGLEPWELGLMETVLRGRLTANGYSLSGAGGRPGVRPLARYGFMAARQRAALHRRLAAERREAGRATYPVAAQLTSGQLALAAPHLR